MPWQSGVMVVGQGHVNGVTMFFDSLMWFAQTKSNLQCSKHISFQILIEEVPLKRMDRPSATEMVRGRAFKWMEKCKKNMIPKADLKWECPYFYHNFFCWRVSVNMKWMDRPSVTEMDIGGVYEMDRQKKCLKMEMPLKWIIFYKICFTCTRMCYYSWYTSVAFPCFCTFPSIHFRGTSSFHICGTWYVYPFQRHFL